MSDTFEDFSAPQFLDFESIDNEDDDQDVFFGKDCFYCVASR